MEGIGAHNKGGGAEGGERVNRLLTRSVDLNPNEKSRGGNREEEREEGKEGRVLQNWGQSW